MFVELECGMLAGPFHVKRSGAVHPPSQILMKFNRAIELLILIAKNYFFEIGLLEKKLWLIKIGCFL